MLIRRLLISGIILSLLMAAPPAFAASVFTDVSSNHPHFKAIQALHEQGVIQGYINNTFRPNQPVNRAEALKIILLGSNIFVPDIQPMDIFPDVIAGVWYDKYVAKAKNIGMVSGDAETGFFRPGDTINLAEILKILIKANDVNVKQPTVHPYADVPPEAWFSSYFDYAKFVGLLDEEAQGNVYPASPVNRSMMAELMYRLSQKPKADSYGKASYYGEKFHGKTTASGDVFDASSMTAAHRSYPFGTWLKVTNIENNQSVVIRVNDRGPYENDRVIDLSKAAFEAISPLSRGVVNVIVELSGESGEAVAVEEDLTFGQQLDANLLNTEEDLCPEKKNLHYIDSNAFAPIVLESKIPSHLVSEEVLTVNGRIQTGHEKVTVFFVDAKGNQTAFTSPVKGERFSVQFNFPKQGEYDLGIIPGETGTSVIQRINVLSHFCLHEKEDSSLIAPSKPVIQIEAGEIKLQWQRANYNLFQLNLVQEGNFKQYLLHDTDEWKPLYSNFADFHEGSISLHLRGAMLPTESLLETDVISWSPPTVLPFHAVTHHAYILEPDRLDIQNIPATVTKGGWIRLNFIPKVSTRPEAALILPNGDVEKVTLNVNGDGIKPSKNKNNVEVFSPEDFQSSDASLSLRYRILYDGLYFVEINDVNGLAVLNIPIYAEGTFPILPHPMDLKNRKTVDLGSDLESLRTRFLELVNNDRTQLKRPKLSLDSQLSQLAQARADDMAANKYFGHWNADGLSTNDLRKNYGIAQIITENLAKDVDLEFAQYGLMRSAIHRENLLNPEWDLAGFGIGKNTDGTYMFVQIFSEHPFKFDDLNALRQNVLEAINKTRLNPLILRDNLNTLAQEWSETMADLDFFDFTNPDGRSLFDIIKEAKFINRIGSYLAGNTSFGDALAQIAQNTALQQDEWVALGVGIKQDSAGIFKITLIYNE